MQSGKILRQRYKIIDSPLGSGGFGDTYLAQDLDLPENPKCVVKHLKPKSSDPGVLPVAQKLFEREAKTLYKLGKDSEQIPKLFAHFQEGTEFYLVQEYIEGHDISKEVTGGKKLSESYTITLLKGILEALAVAHQNNIVHRDIKPQNLMRRKSDNKIVLIDFGAVKEISVLTTAKQPGVTTFTVAVGTPGYMPSEQTRGQPKLSSDIYAVGMVGIKALTGKNLEDLPRDPKTEHIIWRNEARVSDRLANILDRMVHEYFLLRYENATEVLEALNIQTGQTKTVVKTGQTKTVVVNPQTPLNKSRRQILILGALVLVGGILGYFLSPLAKELTQPLAVKSPNSSTVAANTEKSSQQPNSIFSPSLSLDIGSFILINHGDYSHEKLHGPIELLNNTTNKKVKGIISNGSILQVTRKLNKSEETWFELQVVCSTETPSNIDPEFSNVLLQPKDKGWIQEVKIESNLDVMILEKNSEKLDGCFNNY
ncbi:MAG: serine/threonine protein kinase [Okeania sp. SIO3B5]|uniref:serine/threonine-protein kinase n=1 Tax=Okeania sp. SIO3B5 TaxID=2607811 RepID=UPI0013FE6DD8|nr:serine/threonine-protein kinase [Okeania sp. SIO3B5]NEO57290.1 serine/threonine protein kinase [Okeania sp. SIO3B5]